MMHEITLEALDTPSGRRFRSVCTCGWASQHETTNRVMGRGRRHVAAARRVATQRDGDAR